MPTLSPLPTAPPRPRSAYSIFVDEFRRNSTPCANGTDEAIAASERWRTLTPDDRNAYDHRADAEKEQAERGDDSELHIIIFDEFDAICKQRGSTGGGTGVNDSIVNQLLSKIDGVDSLNNILLIGMTNRKDMLDEAVLRPG